MTSAATSYWCYRCNRFVRVWPRDAIVCPDCDGGFLEQTESPPSPFPTSPHHRRVPAALMWLETPRGAPRRSRRAPNADRYPFNPVIVLRNPSDPDPDNGNLELYYDDGEGSGLRPIPASMSDFLMGSGFDRLLDQLGQIELTGGLRSSDHPPASKAAIESMPTVLVGDDRVDSHCAVCTEAFEGGAEAREMPCKHIYHNDCILPWLALRNSCPVCRHQIPTEVRQSEGEDRSTVRGADEEVIGLTIWRLPGGGFAVGRFSGGRRVGERELPVVYTEMDGGFNNSGAPRRISWTSRGNRSRESNGVGRAFRSFLSLFRRNRRSSSPSDGSGSVARSRSGSVFSRRRRDEWSLEDGSDRERW